MNYMCQKLIEIKRTVEMYKIFMAVVRLCKNNTLLTILVFKGCPLYTIVENLKILHFDNVNRKDLKFDNKVK